MYNGGCAFVFDAEIFSQGQMLTFAQKQYHPLYKKGDLIDISFDEGIEVATCDRCGSTDVEIRVFINQETGVPDYSCYEDEDTWCNRCQEHTGVTFKTFKK